MDKPFTNNQPVNYDQNQVPSPALTNPEISQRKDHAPETGYDPLAIVSQKAAEPEQPALNLNKSNLLMKPLSSLEIS